MADNIFDKVLENIDIVDVVKSYVNLEPKGKNLFGLCPFHDDNNPSMSVSREKQIFFCFVCKKGGNAIKFVEEYKHIPYIDATRELAQTYHIDISEFNKSKPNSNQRYYDCMNVAGKFFDFLMNNDTYSQEARDYLSKREINEETIKTFSIGIAPEGNKDLSNTLLSKGFIKSDLLELGLSNDATDIFLNRIMVPIHDEQGRTIAFGGRTYKKNDDASKYVNSKETPIFKKGEVLFNLDNAVKEIQRTKTLIINEGYMDVIQSYNAGIKNAVALMGTSMTMEQAALIKKYTNDVILCLDGDEAGIRAVQSVIKPLEEKAINYSIVILENKMDPDDFIRTKGKDAYKQALVNERIDKLAYLYLLTKLDFGTITEYNMESFKDSIFNRLKDETSNTILEAYLKRISVDLGVSFESISQDFNVFMLKNGYKKSRKTKKVKVNFEVTNARVKAEKMLIDYAIKSYDYFIEINRNLEKYLYLDVQEYRKIFNAIRDIYGQNNNISSENLIINLQERGVYGDFVYNDNIEFTMNDLKNNLFNYLKKEQIKERINLLKEKRLNFINDAEELAKINDEIIKLTKEIKR